MAYSIVVRIPRAAAVLVLAPLLLPARASAQTRLFAVDGATLTTTADPQNSTVRSVSDGGTGVFYAWMAADGGTSLYVTHLSSTGALNPGWPTGNGGAVQVVGNASDSNGFGLASDGNGGLVLLWSGQSGASFGMYGQRISSSGTAVWACGATPCGVAVVPGTPAQELGFGAPYVVGPSGSQKVMFAHAAAPVSAPAAYVLARNLADGSAVAPFSTTNGGFGVLIGTFSSVATGGSNLPQTAFGVNATTVTLTGDQNNGQPSVIADGSGGAFIVYEDSTNGVAHSSSVFVTHYSSAGAVLWGPVSVSSAVSDGSRAVQAAADGNGGVVVFYTIPDGTGYAQRLNASGTKQWGGGAGVRFYTGAAGYVAPVALNTSVIAYGAAEVGISSTTLYARGMNSSDGSAAFSVAVTSVSAQFDAALVASPAGGGQANPGVIFVLSNNLNGAHNDIYAYRVDSTGVNWTTVLSNAVGDKGLKDHNGKAVAVDADGSGGAYAVWVSSQSGPGASLYGARLTVNGALSAGWTTANGVLLANATEAGNLSLAAAGSTGFLAAWTNQTGVSGQNPVYVQQVTGAGAANLGASGRQVGTGNSFASMGGAEGGSAAVLVSGSAPPQFMVSWSSNTGVGAAPVMTQAFDASGNQLYADPGIPAVRDVPSRTVQSLQAVGTGSVLMLAWQESGPVAYDFTQAISTYLPPTGTQTVQPALVTAPSPTTLNPGYIVAFAQNFSTSPYASIVAMKCDVSGTVDWTTLVTNSHFISVLDPTLGNDLAMASDGSGGAYVLWGSSLSSPGGEVDASYLTSAGALAAGWTAGGTRIAYANNAAHLTVAGGSASMIAAWTNGVYGDGGPADPVYAQVMSAAGAPKYSVGSGPAAPGGLQLGVGQTHSNSAVVTNSTSTNADLFVAWTTPLKVQAFDAQGNALFGAGYQAVLHAGGRNQSNANASAAGNDLALGWSEGSGPVSEFSQFITTAIIGPVAPSSPTVTGISSSSFAVSWGTAPALATGYELDVSSDPTFASGVLVSTFGPTASSAAVNGLALNTSWYAQVGSLSTTQPPRYANAAPFPAVTLAPGVTTFMLVTASSYSIKANWMPYFYPQAAGYELDASTASDFSGTVFSSVTYALNPSTLTVTGLQADATYYLRVGALNLSGVANFVSEGSTATAAVLPSAGATVTSSNTVSFSWTSGDAPGTRFRVDLSTDGITLNYSLTVATNGATFVGLASNTTYYGFVTALALAGPNAGPVTLNPGLTLPAAPAALSVAVSSNSLTLSWSANGNSTSTVYTAQFSSTAFASILGSGSSTATVDTQTGLQANTTYYARVFATSVAGSSSAYAVLAATATDPTAPIPGAPAAITASSVTAFWGFGTNGPATLFVAQISTDGFASVNASSQTPGISATFGGLTANTPYSFRVTAVGVAGTQSAATVLPSTWTALLPPSVAATTFLGVNASSAVVQWASGNNGAGTSYYVQASTDILFGSVSASSTTLSTTAVLGAAAALSANTTYYFQVRSSSISNASAFVALGSTITALVPPTAAAPAFTAGAGSLTVAWSSGTASTGFDGPGTVYLVQLSTSPGFSPAVSSTTTALSTSFGGLSGLTLYYLRVAAFGSATGSYGSFVTLGSTVPLTAAPGASAFSGVSTTSVTANWTANGDSAGTQYQVQLSTDPAFGGVILSSVTANLSAPFTGLTPNTTYFGQASAFSVNAGTYTAYTPLGAVATLADPPGAPAVTAVSTGSVTLGWTANGDPAGTLYAAQLSTSASFGGTLLAATGTATSAAFGGLAANTTYYARVEALNSSGTASAFAVAAASSTKAAAPVSAPPTGVSTNSVTANWTAADAAGTVYTAQISTDGFATVNASAQTAALTTTFVGLASNASYNFRVAALGNDGALTPFTTLPSTSTLLLPPAALVSSAAFVSVSTFNAQVAWGSGGNGAGTAYRAQMSTDNFATTNASSSTLNLGALFGQGGQGAALAPNTTYYFRVQTSTTGNASAFVALGSTITPVNAPSAGAFTGVGLTGVTANWTANGDPAGTLYQVQIATAAGFASVTVATQTTATVSAFAGLTPNTTYYARVAAFSSALGAYGAYTALGSTATTAPAPIGAPFTAVSTGSATVNWTANANPAGTVYALVVAADPAFADAVQPTFYTTALNAVLTGLAPNASYYAEVAAYSVNTSTYAAFTPLGSVATLANVPGAAAVAAVSSGSVTLSWTANGDPAGTQYVVQLATNPAFNGTLLISSTVATSTAFAGLGANTSYYLRVEAFNSTGTASSFAVAAGTSTNAALPVAAAPTGLSTGSVVANWTADGNSPTTVYVAQISADGFATVAAASTAPALSAAFTGLSPNTQYSMRVAALANSGAQTPFVTLPSTSTLLLPPATAATVFVNVTTAAAQIAWGNGGNGAGTTFVAQVSTDNFATVLASSVTLNTGALFGAGGAGPALTANTTYFFQVQTTTAGNSSVFVPLGSTVTPSFAPTGTAVLAVASTTVSLSWSGGGNPAGTTYELWRDLTAAFSAPVKTVVSTTGFFASALTPSTSYYFRVRALGFGGAYTGFDSAVSTATLPPAPAVPGTPSGFALGTTSVSWNWSAAAYAASYKLYRASSLSLLASTASTAYFDAGLATNTAYGLEVGGLNATGAGPLTPAATVYTLAAPPAATAAGMVAATSATLSWSLNSNPAGTFAEVQRSSDGAVYASVVSSVVTASYTDASLIGCTSFYYRVRNLNGAGLATGFDATVQIFTANTVPAPASGLTATAAGGNRVGLSWVPSPTEGITVYDVFYDSGTGVVNYAAPLATVPSSMTAYTSAVLTSSGSYIFAVRAKHRCGVEETNGVYATAAATNTIAALRAAVLAPASGHRVDGNSLSVVAGLTSGTPSQVGRILFQYRVAGSSNAWVDMTAVDASHPNPATAPPFFIHWNAAGLAAGGYDLRAVATDISGSTDTAADVVTVSVDHANYDTKEDVTGGQVTRTQVFNTAVTNTFFTGGDNPGDPLIKILIPPAAVSGTTVTATVLPLPTLSTTPPAGYAVSGDLVLRVTLNNGQSLFLGGNTAQISFVYSGTLGAVPQIWSLNELTGVWSNDCANAVVDATNHTISCNSAHFTVFAVLTGGAAAADLGGVRVYPVPYKPNGSDPNQGGGNTGLFFDRLPASASIKIYTAQGRRVTSFDASSPNGKVVWDARNSDGRDVATGLYVAVISSPGQKPVTKKLLIVR